MSLLARLIRHRGAGQQRWLAAALGLALSSAPLAGCGAVYPELHPPIRKPPAGRALSPPPPDDLLFITFDSAEIPSKTRDGRPWDTTGGEKPDPYGLLKIGGREVIHTPTQPNTLHPTWQDQKKANYRVKRGTGVTVELWDENPITDHPICVKHVPDLRGDTSDGKLDIVCGDSDTHITLRVEPAHARVGLGLYYELRTVNIFVTRVVKASPAGRVGLKKGDQILRVQGKDVSSMQEGDAQSLINANASVGVALTVKHADGKVEDVTVKDGPIYPVQRDGIPLD